MSEDRGPPTAWLSTRILKTELWTINMKKIIVCMIPLSSETDQKKVLLQLMSKSILPMFSAGWFMVSHLTFRSFIRSEFIFLMVWGNVLISLFYMKLSSFPRTNYSKDCIFSIVRSCLLSHRLIDYTWVSLFLDSILFHWSTCLFFFNQYQAVLITVVL